MSGPLRASAEPVPEHQKHVQEDTVAIAPHLVDFGFGDVLVSQAGYVNVATIEAGSAKMVALTLVGGSEDDRSGLILTCTAENARSIAAALTSIAGKIEAEAFTAATDALRKAARK